MYLFWGLKNVLCHVGYFLKVFAKYSFCSSSKQQTLRPKIIFLVTIIKIFGLNNSLTLVGFSNSCNFGSFWFFFMNLMPICCIVWPSQMFYVFSWTFQLCEKKMCKKAMTWNADRWLSQQRTRNMLSIFGEEISS